MNINFRRNTAPPDPPRPPPQDRFGTWLTIPRDLEAKWWVELYRGEIRLPVYLGPFNSVDDIQRLSLMLFDAMTSYRATEWRILPKGE